METILKPSVRLRLSRRKKTCVATDPLIFVSSSENSEMRHQLGKTMVMNIIITESHSVEELSLFTDSAVL